MTPQNILSLLRVGPQRISVFVKAAAVDLQDEHKAWDVATGELLDLHNDGKIIIKCNGTVMPRGLRNLIERAQDSTTVELQ